MSESIDHDTKGTDSPSVATSNPNDTIYASIRTPDPPFSLPKRILIIGGGPAGLVALRNLIKHGGFDKVALVERRSDVGGVWNLERDDEETKGEGEKDVPRKPKWPSPAYPGLIGNVLPKFLSFSGAPFPERPLPDDAADPHGKHPQPFPSLDETQAYLRAFAEPFLAEGLIRLNTEAISVEERGWGEGWKVVLRDWNDENEPGKQLEEIWDGVVLAVHWYDFPVWPQTPGLDELKALGLARHAKEWRGPQTAGCEGKVCQAVSLCNMILFLR